MKNSSKEKEKKKEKTQSRNYGLLLDALVVVLFFYAWYLILFSTKTITSGYHLTDDHEFVGIYNDLQSGNVFQVIYKWIHYDVTEHFRFRPIYYLHRVLEVLLFEFNFKSYALHNYFLAVFTSLFLFLFMRNFKVNYISSIAFVLFSLIGAQTAIFWRLGPNETIGIFFISASLFLVSESAVNNNKALIIWLKALALISFILGSLSKESFILISPAIILIIFYFNLEKNDFDLKKSFFSALPESIGYAAVSIIEFSIILFGIGTDKAVEGTSGLGSEKNYFKVISDIITSIYANNLFFLCAIAFISILIYFSIIVFRKIKTIKIFLLQYIIVVLVFLAIIIPQYLIYYKTGMGERYLIPATLGYAFLIALGSDVFWNSLFTNTYVKLFISLIFVIVFYQNAAKTWKEVIISAKNFTLEGKMVNGFLQNFKTANRAKSKVMLVVDAVQNYEWAVSTYFYLKNVYKIDSISFRVIKYNPYVVLEGRDKILNEKFYTWHKPLIVDSLSLQQASYNEKIDFIGIMPGLEQNFYYYSTGWFTTQKQNEFTRISNGYFTTFIRK